MIQYFQSQFVFRMILATVLLVGVAIGAGLVYFLAVPDLEESVSVKEEFSTKTELIRKDTSIKNQITPEHLISTVAAGTFETRFDSIREYTGTNKIPHGTIKWKAKAGGVLQDLDIDADMEIPVVTNTIVRTETVTREVYRPSFYLTGTYESDKSFSPGVTYVRKQFLAGYKYNLSGVNPAARHSFTVGIRLK